MISDNNVKLDSAVDLYCYHAHNTVDHYVSCLHKCVKTSRSKNLPEDSNGYRCNEDDQVFQQKPATSSVVNKCQCSSGTVCLKSVGLRPFTF